MISLPKKLLMVLVVIVMLPLMEGCNISTEISDLAIATGLGIDKTENGYKLTIQLINPGEIASQSKTSRVEVTTYQMTGETLYEALRRLSVEVPRKIYLSHIQLIVFGEEMAKQGIAKSLDFISRNHEFRTDFYILVAKDAKAEDILRVLTPTEPIPSVSVYTSLRTSEKLWAPTKGVKLDQLINDLVEDGINPVLTGVVVKGDEQFGQKTGSVEQVSPAAVLKLIGLAGFKEDKLVGWLNEKESKGYNYIVDNVEKTVGTSTCDDGGKIGIELIESKSKMIADMKNGKPMLKVKVNIKANVGEVECRLDLQDQKTVKKIESWIRRDLTKIVEMSIKAAQKDLKSDIFGFGEVVHREHPKEWKKLKKNWNDVFVQSDVVVEADVKVIRLGTISDSFQKDIEQ